MSVDELLNLRPEPEQALFYMHTSTDVQAGVLQTLIDANGREVSAADIADQNGLSVNQVYRLNLYMRHESSTTGTLLAPPSSTGIALDKDRYSNALTDAYELDIRSRELLRSVGDTAIGHIIEHAALPDRSEETRRLNRETISLLLAHLGLPLQHRHFMGRYQEAGFFTDGQRDRNFARRMSDLVARPLFGKLLTISKSHNQSTHEITPDNLLAAEQQGLITKPSLYSPARPTQKRPKQPKPEPPIVEAKPYIPIEQSEPKPPAQDLPSVIKVDMSPKQAGLAAELIEQLEATRSYVNFTVEERSVLQLIDSRYLQATGSPMIVEDEDGSIRLSILARRSKAYISLAA